MTPPSPSGSPAELPGLGAGLQGDGGPVFPKEVERPVREEG